MEQPNKCVLFDPVSDFFRQCCVRIQGRTASGCGFFIHPSFLVTCAHVIGRDRQPGESVDIRQWGQHSFTARVRAISAFQDLALLETSASTNHFAPLSTEPARRGDPVTAIGYPSVDGNVQMDQMSARIEGATLFHCDDGQTHTLLKLQQGQVEPGYSGGPTILERTSRVVGVLSLTRDSYSDLGGWAVPVAAVLELCHSQEIVPPDPAATWVIGSERAKIYAKRSFLGALA